jgi:hypothetical protein
VSGESSGRLGTAEYAELVGRLHAAAVAALPPGASVLVLSKGDAALVEIPGLAAAHFPQDASGEYAGHHPRDSEDAIAQLERLRRGGAEFLLVPATAQWWLDYYDGFAEHLANVGDPVADVAGTCLIFALGQRTVEAVAAAAEAAPQTPIAQMRDYLENLLSANTRVAVLEAGETLAAALAPVEAAGLAVERLRDDAGGDHGEGHLNGVLAVLARLVDGGAEYLIVPRAADEWLERNADVAAEIEASCRKIADQRHLCRVFELKGVWVAHE